MTDPVPLLPLGTPIAGKLLEIGRSGKIRRSFISQVRLRTCSSRYAKRMPSFAITYENWRTRSAPFVGDQ
jgi:hypothetical protein